MNIKNQIQTNINNARKSRDPVSLSAFQAVLSAIQARETRENVILNDNQLLKVVKNEMLKYQESHDAFKKANRIEEATVAAKTAEVLSRFLPEEITISEALYPAIVQKHIVKVYASSMKDMGAVMASIKEQYNDGIDMKTISSLVRKNLS